MHNPAMPYRYVHTDVTRNAPRTFACDLECRRCPASRNDGEQCSRNVCIWLPYCWQHTQRLLGVKVAPSVALPGSLGMYAVTGFAKGDLVAPYGGEVLKPTEVARRYGSNEYALGPYLLYSVDAACVRYVASAANGAYGVVPRALRNVKLTFTCHRFGTVKRRGEAFSDGKLSRDNMGIKYWSVALRDIAPGEEIVADYGDHGYDTTFARRQERCAQFGVECDRTSRKRSK